MAQYLDPELQPIEELAGEPLSGSEVRGALAIGMFILGASMLMMAGGFHILIGLVAVFNEDFYPVREGYDLKVDTTVWGGVHMVIGALLTTVAVFLLVASAWARFAALIIAILSCIWSFYSIPYYPVWSLIVIAVDIGLIWAIIVFSRELNEEAQRKGS